MASMPGRAEPSMNSSEAPPPVEMKLKAVSSKPNETAAAAESPPPIKVNAPCDVKCFKIRQIFLVPS
jgi:hypothetical protein